MSTDFIHKPWGSYKVIYKDHQCQVKILKINPHSKISYHSHLQRDEQWTVVIGEASVTLDGKEIILKTNDRLFVPRNSKHRIQNKSTYENVKIVEIQTGISFSDDDIFRVD